MTDYYKVDADWEDVIALVTDAVSGESFLVERDGPAWVCSCGMSTRSAMGAKEACVHAGLVSRQMPRRVALRLAAQFKGAGRTGEASPKLPARSLRDEVAQVVNQREVRVSQAVAARQSERSPDVDTSTVTTRRIEPDAARHRSRATGPFGLVDDLAFVGAGSEVRRRET